MNLTLPDWLIALFAIATAVLGVGRLTRVIVYDDFPPAVWIRIQWDTITKDGPWSKLLHCWWCASFWVALACTGWWIGGMFIPWIAWSWWVFWGSLAVSYAGTMVIVRDTPEE